MAYIINIYKLISHGGYPKAAVLAPQTEGDDFGCVVHRSSFIVYVFLFLVLIADCLKAQTYTASPDLGNIKGALQSKFQKPFRLTGGVSLNSVLTENWGYGASNPNPFSWIATGNVNIFLLGTSMPFTFCYSNRKVQYTNPSFKFNRFALHPKYKQWTLHVGDLSTTFSPYTLNGYQYTGVGVEYNKGKWQAQALYGRFLKAVKEDSLTTPSYKRMGWGIKTLYNDKGRKFGLSVFHAKDNPASISSPVLEKNAGITPMENTAFALEGSYPLLQNLLVNFEYSSSILTNNLRLSGDSTANSASLFKRVVGTANSTTAIYHAIKAGFSYTLQSSAIGIAYERVDPGYKTLGAYFFTNDFENITANFTQNLWKGIVIINLNAGLQKDDLNNAKQSRMQRMLFSGNLTVKPSQKINIGLSYSNQQSYTFLRTGFEQINQVTPYQNLDTLNYTQLSQNAGLNCNYTLRQNKEQAQMLTFTCNYMESANKKGDIVRLGDVTRFFNGNTGHSITWQKHGLSLASGVNFSYNYAATVSSLTWGPSLNMTKTLFKNIVRANCGVSYNASSCQRKRIEVINVRTGVTAVIAKKHNLNANVVWQQKEGNAITSSTYLTATAGYAYSF
ncbi:MAG: hypothetical protein Q8909_20295 [Bacteroidota bacterium]|nr:hypothetical protein [Bacteroidota bacterium]